MKKKTTRAHSVRKESKTPPKPLEFRASTDRDGIRRPIEGRIGPDGEPVYQPGSHPRPAPTPKIRCGGCRHWEQFGSRPTGACRSLLSPRAGFVHQDTHACGYGRAHDAQAVA